MLTANSNNQINKGYCLEICVDSIKSALAAQEGGARRIELCNSLADGGTTPSSGLIEITRQNLSIDVHILIRPRRGDFLYSDHEFSVMKRDIALAKSLEANGVVFGILTKNGNIDTERMKELIDLSSPLSVTFHRAFDLTPDPYEALKDLLELRVQRLLTSGQQATAFEGASLIRNLIQRAGNDMVIMPGGGINHKNITEIIKITGASEFHTSARKKVDSQMKFRKANVSMATKAALSEFEDRVSDVNEIREILNKMEVAGIRL